MRIPRLGPGPVFVYEWLVTTRRWQLYALRSVFITLILVGISFIWYAEIANNRPPGQDISIKEAAELGKMLYNTITVIELSLVLLAAPAATAGSICLDKARGTLDHMLATDLSNAEIVLGKLGARLIPVLGLVACVLPVIALISLLGGISSETLLGSLFSVLGSAVLCCSLALLLSVWGRKTHEVLMLTYALIVVWLLTPVLVPLATWAIFGGQGGNYVMTRWMLNLLLSNPFALLFSSSWPLFVSLSRSGSGPEDITPHVIFLIVCLAISALMIVLATVRVRRVALRQAGVPQTRSRSRFAFWRRAKTEEPLPIRRSWLMRNVGPSLDGNPVFWREWHLGRPTRMLRISRFLYSALGCFWLVIILKILGASGNRGVDGELVLMIAFQVTLGLLLLSVSAATSLAEERVRGSLDVLLSTPMSTRSILIGKWWGAFRQIRSPLFWAALLSAPLLLDGLLFNYFLMLGLISAYGAMIASLGLELATSVSRLGRAIALCVSAFLVFSVLWVVVIVSIVRGDNAQSSLIVGSPPVGAFWAITNVSPRIIPNQVQFRHLTAATFGWLVFYCAVAALIFAKTVMTFDRKLGRVSETSRPVPTPPRMLTPKPIIEA